MLNRDEISTIEPSQSIKHYWSDVWHYKELFGFLAWRDILVRYKQTVVGVAWSLIQPLFTMVVFTIVFGKIAKLPSGSVPYPILVFAALLPWQLFANSLGESSQSIVANGPLVSKVYFPRIIIPASSVIVACVDFIVSFLILLALMFFYEFVPTLKILTVPLFLTLGMMLSFGGGLLISAMNVKYRDFRYVVPFIVQMGLYMSPVGFNSTVISEKWRLIYSLNPMVGVIDGFRWAVLGAEFYWPGFLLSVLISIAVYYFGFKFFCKAERSFADFI